MTAAEKGVEVLLFRVGGVRMGVEASQVERMFEADSVECVRFDEIVDFGGRPVEYGAPRALAIRDEGARPAVVVDEPEDFVRVPLAEIRPLPEAVRGRDRTRAFWGAFLRDGEVVLLVDFYKIFSRDAA